MLPITRAAQLLRFHLPLRQCSWPISVTLSQFSLPLVIHFHAEKTWYNQFAESREVHLLTRFMVYVY